MYAQTTLVLVVMVIAFTLASWKLKSAEISMVIAAIAGALAAGFGFPTRLIVEGMFTFFDVGLTFVSAALFINIYSYTGAMDAVIRRMVEKVQSKWVLLIFMAIFMLIPGALTGAGSVSVFVVGGLVATVVQYIGLSSRKTVAFVFIFAILSAAAPPINLWAMLMAAQANMPYVGFDLVLFAPIVVIGTFAIIYLGWGAVPKAREDILEELPPSPEGMSWLRIALPMLSVVALLLLSKYAAFYMPVLGVPLIFLLCAAVAMLVNTRKTSLKEWYQVLVRTIEQVFPLLATVISVGVLVNIMTGTGVRGLVAITFITLPLAFIYVTALFFCPMAQGSLSYGSAVILGTPIIFLFNSIGANVTVVAAALSLMFPLGDALPPSRIVGRVTIETIGYQGSYMSFLKSIAIPCLVMGAVALLMLMFPNFFEFLVVY